MDASFIEGQAQEVRGLLPAPDFSQPGPSAMSLEDAMDKIDGEYGDALELLGRI
ncbi:hypothetical protein JOD54_001971 [Actinokineospora baliensis]|uniref:hypothetical protein n=1 Tax=Actinokineospora baliensis TaxID=547056 RepID=UPI00195D0436|nr:hypothetical protein [Actinokineospora baliensis]MBM7771767.1 hypothetical protein [Actinokineospora baliensis]